MRLKIFVLAAAFGLFSAFGVSQAATVAPANANPAVSTPLMTMDLAETVQYRRGRRFNRNRCRRVCTRRAGRVVCRARGNCRRWNRRGPRPRGCFAIGPIWYCP